MIRVVLDTSVLVAAVIKEYYRVFAYPATPAYKTTQIVSARQLLAILDTPGGTLHPPV